MRTSSERSEQAEIEVDELIETEARASTDPSPETNVESSPRPGSRRAVELALGAPQAWARLLAGSVGWPVAIVAAVLLASVPAARPSMLGVVLGAAWCVGAAWAVGRVMPRALAYARRIPLALLTVAAGGLGACVGAVAATAVVVTSPGLGHRPAWVLAAASFGLAYASLSFVPLLFARLGRAPRWSLAAAEGIAMPVALAFALANTMHL